MRRSLIASISCLTAISLLAACSSPSGPAPGGAAAAAPRKSVDRGTVGGETQPSPAAVRPRPKWKRRIDKLVPNKKMSVHVRYSGASLYSHDARNRRPPASNEKLLLSMALFDALGPDHTIPTNATARRVRKGVVRGALWIKGHGDPTLSKGGPHSTVLQFGATRLKALIRKLKRAGIKRVDGNVMASTRYFGRDWNAHGWEPDFNDEQVAFPTALALNGNVHKGHFTGNPELVLARLFRKRLEKSGIAVGGSAYAGAPPSGLKTIASVESAPVAVLARFMNRTSSNFFAEMLGKLLDVRIGGPPGSIRGGAGRLKRWARLTGVRAKAFDSSGLSYENKISARGIVNLLEAAKERSWVSVLRRSLPKGGQGTLQDRFPHVRLRAKTGTLQEVSTLSGWVWLKRANDWAEFSIMSRGLDKSRAVELENKIVRLLSRRGH